MKNIVKIFAAAAASMFAFSCTPEYPTPDKNNLPQASNLTPVITVDQETNYVTFSIQETGVVPMWIFGEDKVDGKANKKYAYTGNGISLRMRDAGTHTVELKAYNANGVSLGSKMVEYTLENTYRDPFDPTPIINNLASNDWYWNKAENDHFGCGHSITADDWPGLERYGLSWWACEAEGKAGFNMYDDKMVFTADGKYQYDPVDGKTYVNKDSGYKTQFKTDNEDYVVEIDALECNYTLEQVWNAAGIEEIYLELENGANLSYIPNPEALTNPRYMILNHSKRLVTFVVDNGDISWRYQFAPKGKEPGLDYEADTNIWKPIDASESTHEYGFWYAPGWNQIADPEVTHSGDTYTITLPEATTDQWMAQFHIDPNADNAIAIDASKTYAFSCLVQTNKTLKGMTFKLTDATSDSNFLFETKKEIAAGKEYLFELKGIAMTEASAENMKLFFDFGGNEADTKVSIRRITLQEYVAPAASINDVPFVGGKADLTLAKGDAITLTGVEPTWWDPDFFEDGKFIAESGDYSIMVVDNWLKVIPMVDGEAANWSNGKQIWIIGEGAGKPQGSQPGWSTGIAADLPFAKTGEGTYQITLWCSTNTNVKVFGQADWGKEWLTADYASINGNGFIETTADDGNLHSVAGMEAGWYVFTIKDNGDGAFDLTVDRMKEVYFDIAGETNFFRPEKITNTFWYSNPDWNQLGDPEFTADGGEYTIFAPADGSYGHARWQAQNWWRTETSVEASKTYDFCVTLISSTDIDKMVMVKLAAASYEKEDDSHYFFAVEVPLEAGVPYTFTQKNFAPVSKAGDDAGKAGSWNKISLVIDCGPAEAGTQIKVSDLCFQEHMTK